MEYIEIILQDIPVSSLGTVFSEQLRFRPSDVRSSHCCSSAVGEVCQYADVEDWDAFFCGRGVSDFFLARIDVGMELRDAVVVISHDRSLGDVTIQFGEDQLRFPDSAEAERSCRGLFQRLAEISRDCRVGGVVIGYEPAEDWDMRVLEIHGDSFRTFPENSSHSPELRELCRVGSMYFRL